jgi:methyl-accepting chemotaxis protein
MVEDLVAGAEEQSASSEEMSGAVETTTRAIASIAAQKEDISQAVKR